MGVQKKYLVLLVLIGASLIAGLAAKTKMQQGGQAYVYGYPLLLMQETKNTMLKGQSQVNHFTHNRIFPDHTFRNVVRPNDDTLYSVAWLDLNDDPVVLSVPNTEGRYYVMPFMDAFTNVFATVGKRETGTQAGAYLVTGPDWSGKVPAKLSQIKAPTNSVWLVGRIQTNGNNDIAAVARLQNQFSLASLRDFQTGKFNKSFTKLEIKSEASVSPSATIASLSTEDYLTRLGELLKVTHTPTRDSKALKNLEAIEVSQTKGFKREKVNRLELWLIEKGFAAAKEQLETKLNNRKPNANGWLVLRKGIGRYGTNYGIRASIAKVGLGALPPEEAAYPNARVDSKGRPLNGNNSYKLKFAQGELPPAKAFWSMSMYGDDNFFVDNSIGRYSISDREKLNVNQDGSVTIVMQHQRPKDPNANWLPSPEGRFEVNLRLYLPGDKFINGEWTLPAIERIEE